MEKWKKRAVDLISSLALGGRSDPSVVPYYPQKIRIGRPEERLFRRGNPERHGISSKRIYNMLCELEAERRANIHSLMVIAGGEVISECSADGYDVTSWHISHSMAKTVTGMIVGILVDDGLLSVDRRLVDIFPEIDYRDKKFPLITVDHLLSMTSGVEFAEAGVITESNWTEAFFSSAVRFTPGTKFAYNSMNSYILARIVERVSGRAFGDIANERFFAPLGITSYLWEISSEGTEKGGWGLYMSPESWARVGYMLMYGGTFMGQRILSEDWVAISTAVKAVAPEVNGSFNYAYQMWTSRTGNETLFNGMLGQNVWLCPRNDIIVVMTGGNNEIFQASPALEIVRKYLGGRIEDRFNRRDVATLREKEALFFECRRWVHPRERSRGFLYWLGLKPRTEFDDAWNAALGDYVFGNNNVGMLPLIVRAMQNSLNCRLTGLSLSRVGEELWLSYIESGEQYNIKVGLYGYERNIISVRGEKYVVMAMGEATFDSSGGREYRIELILPETASTRMLRITRPDLGRINLELLETPNNRLVENLLARYSEMYPKLAIGIDLLERRLGKGVVAETVKKAFNPTLVGASTELSGFETVIDEENRRMAEETRTARLIKMLIDRFFRETELRAQREEKTADMKTKNPIGSIVKKISEKNKNGNKM